ISGFKMNTIDNNYHIPKNQTLFSFSPERPFGISLYDYFDKVYTLINGNSSDEFAFTVGSTPFSTWYYVISASITYLIVVFGGQYLMRNTDVIKAKFIFQLHNFLLTGVSFSLLLLLFEQLFPVWYHHGLFHSLCAKEAWTQRLEILFYLNYLVKYWELTDTVFLVLRKKSLGFLHVYHHTFTVWMCYVDLIGKPPMSYVPITLNLAVHVPMYYYYFRAAGGARIWWKKYLTTMQITQFVLDLIFVYFCSYVYFSHLYLHDLLPSWGGCAGDHASALFGMGLLSSYLVLFVDFYKQTYSSATRGKESINGVKKDIKKTVNEKIVEK
ncbi:5204_t:CDS:2, partial [Ambispora leptoticha]